MSITTLHGDCTELLPTLAPGSVQCIVTSPPYFGLRDYGLPPTDWPAIEYVPMAGLPSITIPAMACCLGLESDPLAFVAHLVHVFRLARPALRDDGAAWLNLGDCYAQSGISGLNDGWAERAAQQYAGGGHKAAPARIREKKTIPTGLKQKDLMMIPARVALALQADGWYVRNQAIWWKPNCMPEAVTDRLTNDYEPLYLLAKSARYYFDQAAIAEPAQEHHAAAALFKRNGNKRSDALVPGNNASHRADRADKLYSGGTRNRRTVWRVATEPLRDAHYAPMPQALAEPCIRAGSSAQACEHCGAAWVRVVERESNWQERKAAGTTAGNVGVSDTYQNGVHGKNMSHDLQPKAVRDLGFAAACTCPGNTGSAASVVLDMFAGSGTVLRVAERLQRSSIGIDLNGDYIEIQHRRTDGVQVELFV